MYLLQVNIEKDKYTFYMHIKVFTDFSVSYFSVVFKILVSFVQTAQQLELRSISRDVSTGATGATAVAPKI